MDKKIQDKSIKIEWELFNVEQQYTSAPYIPAMCAAFALYLSHTASGEISLKGILDANNIPADLANFIITSIGEHWSKYQPFLTTYSDDELADLFACGVSGERMYELSGHMHAGECTPLNVVNLVLKLLDVHPNDSVADVCSGAGDFLKSAYFSAYIDGDKNRIVGYEISTPVAALSRMRMIVDDAHVKIHNMSCFNDRYGHEKFNKVFSHSPLGVSYLGKDPAVLKFITTELPDFPVLNPTMSGDWLFAARAVAAMAKGGRGVCILSPSAMFDGRNEPYRQYFLQRNLIEAVIELPPRLFPDVGIPTYMVVFSEGNDQVKMVKAGELCESGRRASRFLDGHVRQICMALGLQQACDNIDMRNIVVTVSKKDILADGCDLTVAKHFVKPVALKHRVSLGSVVVETKRGSAIKSEEIASLRTDKPTSCLYLALGDLNDGVIDTTALVHLKDVPEKYQDACLHNGDLVITRVMSNGANFNVAVVDQPDDVTLLPCGNIIVLTLDKTKADPYFIKACLDSAYAQQYLQAGSTGAVIKMLNNKSLNALPVPLLPLARQRKIGSACRVAVRKVLESHARYAEAKKSLNRVLAEHGAECFEKKEG